MEQQILNKLKENKLFENADTQKLSKVLDSEGCRICKFRSGMEIDICSRIAFVVSGSVCVYSVDEKRRLLLRKIEENEVFGVAGLFTECSKMSKSFAKGTTEVLFIDSETVKWLLENDKNIMYNYISFLSGRISYLNKK